MVTLSHMIKRIVLSTLFCMSLLLACAGDPALDDDPIVADGIGTSPSVKSDAGTDALDLMVVATPCGIWVDVSTEAADARSLACAPPDVIVFATSRTWCYDAGGIAEYYPAWHGRSFVRRLTPQLRAVEATCP